MIAALLFAAAGLFFGARAFDDALPRPLAANLAVPITLADGSTSVLGQLIHRDRPTVINLWASWCGPCRLEAPTVVDLHQRFGQRINLIYLNVRDEAATPSDLSTYMTTIGLPSGAYARMDRREISRLTGAENDLVPRTMVFDRAGRPTAMITGYKPLALARVAGIVDQ